MGNQFLGKIVRRPHTTFQGHKSIYALSFDVMAYTYHRCLGNLGMRHQSTLNFRSAQAVSGHINDIIYTPHQPVIAILIHPGTVAGIVNAREAGKISLSKPLWLTVHTTHQTRPGSLYHQIATLVDSGGSTILPQHCWFNTWKRYRCRARLGWYCAR